MKICYLSSIAFRLCVFWILCTHLFYFILQIFLKLWRILGGNIIFLRLRVFSIFLWSRWLNEILIGIELLKLILIRVIYCYMGLLLFKMTSILLKIILILPFGIGIKLFSVFKVIALRVILLTWIVTYCHLLLTLCIFLVGH